MADRVIAGAVDTPLTPHNLAQMKALKIYSKAAENKNYPVRSLDLSKTSNSLILGEAAIIAILEKVNKESLFVIKSAGYATELQKHPVAVDSEGIGLQNSMRMALKSAGLAQSTSSSAMLRARWKVTKQKLEPSTMFSTSAH